MVGCSDSIVCVIVQLFVLELLSQTEVVLHLMFGILMERAWAVEDLLVLLVVVVLGARFIDGGDDVVWPATVILTRLGSFWPITTAVPMITAVVVAAVVVASVVAAVSWAMSARILVEAHFGFFGVDVLVGGRNHLPNPHGRLVVELGAEVAVMESSDKGGDDLSFYDVRNRISHLRKASDVATEELGWLLVDAVQIMLGARPSTHSYVVIGEDLL